MFDQVEAMFVANPLLALLFYGALAVILFLLVVAASMVIIARLPTAGPPGGVGGLPRGMRQDEYEYTPQLAQEQAQSAAKPPGL